jgi:LacI family transcriptional regulator
MQAFIVDGGVSIPQDVSIVGYDDIDYSATAIVPLSSVRQSPELIGQTAIELLLADTPDAGPNPQVVLQPELVIRASSRR